jgi:UDP-N-acetylmuramyl pentapeptide phosphotransferase/UDP-N-acetylglucosamine-1-phosphate transferase
VTRSVRRRLVLVVLAGGSAHLAAGAVRRRHPGGSVRWERDNYRGRRVDLAGGPGAAAGLLTAAVAAGSPAALIVTAAAAGLGAYDDLASHPQARGLRGHAAALRAGVVTSGVVKLVGLTAAGLASAPSRPRRAGSVVLDTVLVAGTANLVNLLDLRPGRALKLTAGIAAPMTTVNGAGGDLAAAVAGVTLGLLPADLGERQMLGDCGANALGAAIGWSLAARLSGVARCLAAAAVVALTVASERVSFTEVIERQPALAALDRWGRCRP